MKGKSLSNNSHEMCVMFVSGMMELQNPPTPNPPQRRVTRASSHATCHSGSEWSLTQFTLNS